ncbi:MAG: hypothetical protein AAF985_21275, partial [Bacteroidota bacterium]
MKNLLLSILLLLPLWMFAQTDAAFMETKNAKKSLRYAQSLINKGQLKKAKKQLQHTIKVKDDFAVAYRELGMVCLELEEYGPAIDAFNKSFELDDKLSRAAFFECGEAHFKQGDSEKGMEFFQKYMDLKHTGYANKQKESGLEVAYDLLLPERLQNCAYLKQLPTADPSIAPENMGNNINSANDDYLPTITSDGEHLVYTRTERNEDQNIYISRFEGIDWNKGKPFGQQLNTDKNEGMAKFEAHGRAFYFAGCMRADTEGGCDIYQANLHDGQIESVNRLDGTLNSRFWDSQPSITCDGTAMYFSSTRDGGLGGADIWVSYLNTKGQWGTPINPGPSINSPGDEEAPYISNDGHTLYFSSTGHPGQGDGDLFMARYDGQTWSKAQNMDHPFNSPAKEMGIYVQADGKTAYFSSARPGGKGGLDIYKVELPEQFRPNPIVQVSGTVVDAVTGEPVECTVKITRKEQKTSLQTNEEGWFFLCLSGDKGYSFQINEKGYEYFMDAQFLASGNHKKPIELAFQLQPIQKARPELVAKGIPLKEKRIQFFFDFDSYELSQEAT